MPKVKNPTEPYSGRNLDAVVINTTLDHEAVQTLYAFCPKGRKTTGKFLSRLIYEHAARVAERHKLQQALQAVCAEEVSTSA
jgi:hypothetical protein